MTEQIKLALSMIFEPLSTVSLCERVFPFLLKNNAFWVVYARSQQLKVELVQDRFLCFAIGITRHRKSRHNDISSNEMLCMRI